MTTGVGGLGLMACLQYLGIPWVWHLMDDVPAQLCRRGDGAIPALAEEFGRQIRGHYLACSQRVVDEIQAGGIRLEGEVEIIPNWVTGHIPTERSAYLPGGKLRVVYAGQIAHHKGVRPHPRGRPPGARSGSLQFPDRSLRQSRRRGFPDLARSLDVTGFVTFRGARTQPELLELYGDYDVFAFPTWEREPFAFAPLEAAARGCVPILSEVCGNSEWMVDRVHCLKTPRTAEALASVFVRIMEGRIDLEPLGRRTAAMVRRDHHLDILVARIERALERSARVPRTAAGSVEEAYRLALMAEKLAMVLVQESYRAA